MRVVQRAVEQVHLPLPRPAVERRREILLGRPPLERAEAGAGAAKVRRGLLVVTAGRSREVGGDRRGCIRRTGECASGGLGGSDAAHDAQAAAAAEEVLVSLGSRTLKCE